MVSWALACPLESLAADQAEPEAPQAPERRTTGSIERALLDAGLENVTVHPGDGIQIAYENRRYRRSTEVLGLVRAAAGERILVGERRLGIMAAALEPPEGGDGPFRVRFPSDGDFPRAPEGPMRSGTFARADLELGALVDYRLGNLFDPLQIQTQLEPRLVLNPWPGARVRAGIAIPVQNNYPLSDASPDLNRVRPGRASLDQFGWVSGLALFSFSGGYFGDNRWGASVGVARPLRGGEWLLDAQLDRTGFLAFMDEGTLYSPAEQTSGFAGVTYRPPLEADLALKARAGQFLYGDRGVELELRRSFDDLDVAYFAQHADGLNFYGIRLDLPVWPRLRASGVPVRVQPTPRFALNFRDQDLVSGTFLDGVASRENYLRQLSTTSLAAGRGRYESSRGQPVAAPAATRAEWVSFTGMTGFIHTPWAGVLADRGIEMGYGFIPQEWAYARRGQNDNQVFYTTLGFLPRVETSLRWTRLEGYRSFEEIVPESKFVDMDRMASARVAVLEPAPLRPGLAFGIEDAHGTRRYHSTYAVAGMPFAILGREFRVAAGYGFQMFTAARYVLDGMFGAVEFSPWSWARTQVEYDTEKWSAGVGLSPGLGLQVRAALLNLESPSIGAGWSYRL